MRTGQLVIPIRPDVKLLIYSSRSPLFEEDDASDYGESRWQLQEGGEYEYELVDTSLDSPACWFLEGPESILSTNQRHKNRGIINTGIYVGLLSLKARNAASKDSETIFFEIRSYKSDYRTHYKKMLTDITGYYTDLVMQQGSPVTQKFEVDYDAPQTTLYQKFAFVRSIVDNEQFEEAIHKVLSNPVKKWKEVMADSHIESIKRLTRDGIKQIANRRDRVPYPKSNHILQTVPRYIEVTKKVDSVDTPENQFIKYVLSSFYSFCSNLGTKKYANTQLKQETNAICNKLNRHINSSLFKDVSNPHHLNIGSPVLQRKEGYREILQAWLLFDLAAKLSWKGAENVYDAGKKNVAVLYEYWVFFKLLECVSDIFKIAPVNKSELISSDEDRINLEIQQGHTRMISGSTVFDYRKLNISLYYNRTFLYTDSDKLDTAGSWTMNMRPDYTLSIWPGDLTEERAESEDSIVHIHFDAKYRLNRIIIEDKNKDLDIIDTELQSEKDNSQIDIYKRGDLLKMHAYKDAIRRTGGAYVIYPGSEEKIRKGFHEIIPGLGAFCLAPGHESEQLSSLRQFVKDIVSHFMDRNNQREKIAITEHNIHSKIQAPFYETFPEPHKSNIFPDSINVLLGCYKSEEQLNWIINKGKYNIRCGGTREGAIELDDLFINANYLLIYNLEDLSVKHFMKITQKHPAVVSDSILSKMGYPNPTKGQMYLLYDVSADEVEPEIKDRPWNIESLVKDSNGSPLIVSYIELFEK